MRLGLYTFINTAKGKSDINTTVICKLNTVLWQCL